MLVSWWLFRDAFGERWLRRVLLGSIIVELTFWVGSIGLILWLALARKP